MIVAWGHVLGNFSGSSGPSASHGVHGSAVEFLPLTFLPVYYTTFRLGQIRLEGIETEGPMRATRCIVLCRLLHVSILEG